MSRKIRVTILAVCHLQFALAQNPVAKTESKRYDIAGASILVDSSDYTVVQNAAFFLARDLQSVTMKSSAIGLEGIGTTTTAIIIGSLDRSTRIKELIKTHRIAVNEIRGKWEAYKILTVTNPTRELKQALVIIGADRRGAAYGVMELCKRIGVSPWNWWADVPVKKRAQVWMDADSVLVDAPKVKYRGIFINDEAPALSNWSRETFGGFNSKFYARVFELMLRLKANYIWPAMWGNAFYDDDSLNIKTADDFGIVIGTSHHEPLMRAHDEWRRYGKKQLWNYDSTKKGLQEFWTYGMKRAWNEKIVSVGMRGDGDEPMSRETATALLERIVGDQRKIISKVTGRPASKTPQLWALYKEVQDYYKKGMRVPDDVTLLLCDDNWGNLRMLPRPGSKKRSGGYGIYYHFDYVGGPRNYKWINTNPLPRIWEQMHLAWEHDVKQIWIVNVGDIKPMELPISFFLDYAWNPDRIGADSIFGYTKQWAVQQFGSVHAEEIASLLSGYTKFNARRKPELLNEHTYSFNYDEWDRVVLEYRNLQERAKQIQAVLDPIYSNAYFQLVLHPIEASANLYQLYHQAALGNAEKVAELYQRDSLITLAYHQLNKGKWNHMMSQTHIGYTYWQQPPVNKMPIVKKTAAVMVYKKTEDSIIRIRKANYPKELTGTAFFELNGVVSIEAAHFTKAYTSGVVNWVVLPDIGRTGDGITSFPVTADSSSGHYLEYDIYTYSQDSCTLYSYFSPTLNYYGTDNGLQYAISIDDEIPQLLSLNKEDKNSNSGIWNRWVAENIIIKSSRHKIAGPGKHRVRFWRVSPGVVLQKLVLDFGGMKPSYLGPPETRINTQQQIAK